jgi:hypothetical protein
MFTQPSASEYGGPGEWSTNQGSSISCWRLGAYTNENCRSHSLSMGSLLRSRGSDEAVGSPDPNLKFANRFPRAADRLRSGQGFPPARNSVARSAAATGPGVNVQFFFPALGYPFVFAVRRTEPVRASPGLAVRRRRVVARSASIDRRALCSRPSCRSGRA